MRQSLLDQGRMIEKDIYVDDLKEDSSKSN